MSHNFCTTSCLHFKLAYDALSVCLSCPPREGAPASFSMARSLELCRPVHACTLSLLLQKQASWINDSEGGLTSCNVAMFHALGKPSQASAA
jgi:hypothetical protein